MGLDLEPRGTRDRLQTLLRDAISDNVDLDTDFFYLSNSTSLSRIVRSIAGETCGCRTPKVLGPRPFFISKTNCSIKAALIEHFHGERETTKIESIRLNLTLEPPIEN